MCSGCRIFRDEVDTRDGKEGKRLTMVIAASPILSTIMILNE